MPQSKWVRQIAALTLAVLNVHGQVLPPPPAAGAELPPELFVREFQFEGATAFSPAELSSVTAPYTGRTLTAPELEEARRALTLHYVNHGYINSGAILPDQDPTNGVVRIQIVEGVLTKTEVRENRWLRDGYIETQLRRWSSPPLNLNELKEGLQLLRLNPNIQQINAELMPGAVPGESILDVRAEDRQPFRLYLDIDNARPPGVGAEQITVRGADLNLTGNSDVLEFDYGIANSGADGDNWGFSGTDDIGGRYQLPIGRYNTTVGLHGSRVSTSVVEEPFTLLDIESEITSYGVFVRQPLFQTARSEFALIAGFDRRANETVLLGDPFDFEGSGSVRGETEASIFRFSQEWIDRGQNHVLALRSTFNFGADVFGATDSGFSAEPDATFFSWVGQGQYVQRLFNTGNRAIVRVTGQWTDERLLAMEQMAVGGASTVRGYRENQLVRDRAVVASLEFRIPVFSDKAGLSLVELAPFVDFGHARDINERSDLDTLASVGIGLLLTPCKYFDAQLYWGYRLKEVDYPDTNAQDLGLHFRIRFAAY